MASKLEPHEKFILEQLLQRRSYQSITESLSNLGCKTSRQNLMSWVKNRAEKLRARRELADPSPSVVFVNQVAPAAPKFQAKATPKSESVKAVEPVRVASHNPQDLNKIMSDKPDMAALERAGKAARKANR